jgi:Ser/Thr protein kinase RdoA (MazF antagonist)
LAASLPAAPPRALHRDFHPDQVLVDGERLWLLDLDLQAQGNGALDAGNFTAHLVERGLCDPRGAHSLCSARRAFVKRFTELEPGAGLGVIEAWETLSLARHVQISTLLPERRPCTEALLDHCEARLAFPARRAKERPALALQAC